MRIAKLMSVVCAAGLLMVVGCNKDNKAAAGEMGAKKSECCQEGKKSDMGAVGTKSDCCAEGKKSNMGAVGTKGECTTKTECTDSKANMGAVKAKSDCSTKT